ncbi:MAG: hypothetical protein IRY99_18060 [Isosphaeraceae bacterium]|nr:hypothetical protein [Isosphaeraceae bacterium]
MATPAEAERAEGASGRRVFAAAATCAVVGVLLSALPDLLWWPRLGIPFWSWADRDDLFYLAAAAQAYDNHPLRLADPAVVAGGHNIYPWLQLGPGVLVAKVLGLGPLGIHIIWAVWAGLSISLGLFLVINHYLQQPWITAGLTILLLADHGSSIGQPLFRHMVCLGQWLSAEFGGQSGFDLKSLHNITFRIANPGLTLIYLLLHLWLIARARERPTWPRIIAAGLGFGLLFYVYFYYWTAAGLALMLALLLDAGHRRVYFHTGWIGGLIGLPAVISGILLKRSTALNWQLRSDFFVPIARFSELLIPKMDLVLLAIGLVWVLRRRRDLIYLWALTTAGMVLANHQILSGLQIQNFHWLYYVAWWGLGLLLYLAIAGELFARSARSRLAAGGLFALCVIYLASGLWLRALEATRTPASRAALTECQHYREQRFEPGAPRLVPNSVVAGDLAFVDYALILENQRPVDDLAIVHSPSIDGPEWYARMALNAYLRGLDLPAFEANRSPSEVEEWGPWANGRDPSQRAEHQARRRAAFEQVQADPAAALDRFRVRYVALPAEQTPPAYLEMGWQRLQAGPYWQIWERTEPRRPGR